MSKIDLEQPSKQEDFRRELYFFAPPKRTTSERDELKNKVEGMMIWNETLNKIQYFDGTNWITI